MARKVNAPSAKPALDKLSEKLESIIATAKKNGVTLDREGAKQILTAQCARTINSAVIKARQAENREYRAFEARTMNNKVWANLVEKDADKAQALATSGTAKTAGFLKKGTSVRLVAVSYIDSQGVSKTKWVPEVCKSVEHKA